MTNRNHSCYTILLIFLAIGGTALMAQQKSASGSKPLASVNGKPITEDDVNRAASDDLDKLELQKLQAEVNFTRNSYEIRQNALKRLVEEQVLDAEAAKQGISRTDLLAKEVDQKVKDPTPDEINAFYEANKARITTPKEQVLPQIQQYLKQQSLTKVKDALIERLKKEQNVAIYLEDLRYEVATAGFPVRGPEEAPVTIVEFSDFQCPFCRNFSTTLNRISRQFPNHVRVVYRQLPLTEIHPLAEKAAEASLCAQEQGRFWEFHDQIFRDQSPLSLDGIKSKAQAIGLDTAAFNSCLDSGRQEQKVKKDIRDGATLGVSGTPAIFINGRFLNGARPYEEVAAVVLEEIQKKNAGVAKP